MAKTKQWAALTAVLVLLILAAGWFLLVSPKRSATTALNATAAKQEQDNATVRTQIAALKAQALDLPKKQARLTEISARMPDNPALPSLIRALSDAADKANVDLMSLSPSAPVALTAAVPATVGLATPPVAVQQIPLALTVQGKFFQMEQFLSNLESLPRAFVVTTLGVAPAAPAAGAAAGGATAPPVGSLTGTVSAMVFMAPAMTAATPAPAVGTAPGAMTAPAPTTSLPSR